MLVETNGLTKRYGRVTALDDCSLAVRRGEVFGLLGPNGAGKTTLLRLLLGMLRPTSGTATVAGLDCRRQSLQVRHRLAYLPGDVRLAGGMKAREALAFFAGLRGADAKKSIALAEQLELDLSRRVAYMSTGMRQKLALAATLAADVPLLVLDEPTANLDPTVRHQVMQFVAAARDESRSVLFSSHVLSEVEEVCDRVAILRRGRLAHTQVISQLRTQHRIHARLAGPLPTIPPELNGQVSIAAGEGDQVTIDAPGSLAPLLKWLATLPVDEMHVEPVGLKAVYDRFHAAGAADAE